MRSRANRLCLLACTVGAALVPSAWGAKKENPWVAANDFADRLTGEKWAYGVVRRELGELRTAGEDLRAIWEYPPPLTGLSSQDVEDIRKDVDKTLKKATEASKLLLEFEKPLEDAVSIGVEMFKENPNLDMMDLLTQDNITRVRSLVRVKKFVDGIWEDFSAILERLETKAALNYKKADRDEAESEFINVLMDQTGVASDVFFSRLHDYKDSLAAMGSRAERRWMATKDLGRIKRRADPSHLKGTQRDLARLVARYHKKIAIGGVYYLLGESYLWAWEYQKAVDAFRGVPPDSRYFAQSRLGVMEGFFGLEMDDSVAVVFETHFKNSAGREATLESARYLAIQSYYALDRFADLERTVLSYPGKSQGYYRSLRLYGKALAGRGRDDETGEIWKSIINQRQLERSIRLGAKLDLAYLQYEQGYIQSAFAEFKALLGEEAFQAGALYGTAWCYFQLRDLPAAELALRKLVNQFPDHPRAVEALRTLAQWRFSKAEKLWEYKRHTEANRFKLRQYRHLLDSLGRTGELPQAVSIDLAQKFAEVEETLNSRLDVSLADIEKHFQESMNLMDYLRTRYRTGEYSEVEFRGSRETALYKLRSLALGTAAGDLAIPYKREFPERRGKLLEALYRSRQVGLDMSLRYRQWMRECIAHLRHPVETIPRDSSTVDVAGLSAFTQSAADSIAVRLQERIRSFSFSIAGEIDSLLSVENAPRVSAKLLFYKGLLMFQQTLEEHRFRRAQSSWRPGEASASASNAADTPSRISGESMQHELVWTKALRQYPDSVYSPITRYYLGYSKIWFVDPEGKKILEDLVLGKPGSPLPQRAELLLGDHFFHRREYGLATEHFGRILATPRSSLFDKAVYKCAWSLYFSGHFEKALKGFEFLLRDQYARDPWDRDPLLAEESLGMLARSLAELDTTSAWNRGRLREYTSRFAIPELRPRILHQTAKAFRRQGRLYKARKILEMLASGNPKGSQAPEILLDLAMVYDIDNDYSEAARFRNKVYEKYRRGSSWYQSLRHPDERARTDSLCQSALEKFATYHFARAKWKAAGPQGKGGAGLEAFKQAIEVHEKFFETYPGARSAPRLYNQLAESYFAIDDYYQAARAYIHASLDEAPENSSAAAYNAVVAARKFLEASVVDPR